MPESLIQRVAVPEAAPPYDDAAPSRARAIRRALRALPADARPLTSGDPAGQLPAGPWPSQFAQVLAETLAGSRPPKQLTPWTTEQTRKQISRLSATLATTQQPRLRRVIVRSPADGVVEMTVIVWMGARACALAVRLERDQADPPEPTDPAGQARRPAPSPHWPARPPTASGPARGGTGGTGAARARAQAARWYCTAIEAA